ncbi:hypothetical protein [Stenotrophomonas maltophilia]|uniref:hypothetical protein n=1 Tax=Stenotrophomonas maltophilia TaxID=40324 RepID=UPI0039F6FC69
MLIFKAGTVVIRQDPRTKVNPKRSPIEVEGDLHTDIVGLPLKPLHSIQDLLRPEGQYRVKLRVATQRPKHLSARIGE